MNAGKRGTNELDWDAPKEAGRLGRQAVLARVGAVLGGKRPLQLLHQGVDPTLVSPAAKLITASYVIVSFYVS
jgi:hypothetical protein